MSKNKQLELERYKKFEAKLKKCIEKVQKSTGVRVSFREINVNEDDLIHDFDAPGDIYKTFHAIQNAVLHEYQLDLEDVQSQIAKMEKELIE